jgi:2-polyprenyl-3-methyl-5-hydroxy-6-metoxy-1,4-benzoquinol methylase
MEALFWEASYRKRAKGAETGETFLADADFLDEDFARAIRNSGIRHGKLLEIGTGGGWQAIHFARLGFDVTATDVSQTCLAQAARNCAISQVNVRFLLDNILSTSLTEQFDVVVDRGCFTTLPFLFLSDYATQVAKLIRSHGIFLLKMDRKSEDRLSYLLSAFVCSQTVHGAYLGSKDIVYKATFCLLQPMISPI